MTRRTREQMLDETRRLLLDAGRQFFGTVGYAATSMDQLTDSVGLTRGALYHHFGGKSGLFAAVVAAVDAEIDTELDQITAQAPDPLAALAERGAAYIELTQAPEVQQLLFHDAPAVLPHAVETSTAACIASIARLIEAGQTAELIPTTVPPEAPAVLINGALVDASRWVTAAPEDQHTERRRQATEGARVLITGLGGR
ncbi:TetR/AcrR family transcriptional regulator [Nesterenkonia ebinurensis]|uniref:TetR/AcrR family transcriptional regulator n=1 Tax=Nesterenkonia ebinurensis TaxID=2608252 RepID=UPI001CC6E2E8|nr:TetR/AcrR family transcriptional regulator [Nesterenkonia ebinurensis]